MPNHQLTTIIRTWHLFAVLISVLVVSCSKDKISGQIGDPCDQIVEVEQYLPVGPVEWESLATYEYDSKDRLKSFGDGTNTTTYTYHKDRIDATFSNNSNVTSYYLDAKGRIKGTSHFDHQYTYDGNGYLTSFRSPYGTGGQILGYVLYTLKYENNDLIEVSTSDQSVSNKKITFQYYNEINQDLLGYNQPLYIASVLGSRESFYLVKAGFFGKQSAHLYKTLSINDVPPTGQMQYTKDAKGRIISTNYYRFSYRCP